MSLVLLKERPSHSQCWIASRSCIYSNETRGIGLNRFVKFYYGQHHIVRWKSLQAQVSFHVAAVSPAGHVYQPRTLALRSIHYIPEEMCISLSTIQRGRYPKKAVTFHNNGPDRRLP